MAAAGVALDMLPDPQAAGTVGLEVMQLESEQETTDNTCAQEQTAVAEL